MARVAGNGSQTGRRAKANPRLGRCGRRHSWPAKQRRIERLSLFPRPRPGARDRRPKAGRRNSHRSRRTSSSVAGTLGIRVSVCPHTMPTCSSTKASRLSIISCRLPKRAATAKRPPIGLRRMCLRLLKERDLTIEEMPVSSAAARRPDQESESPAKFPAHEPARFFRRWSTRGVDAAAAMQSIGIAAVDESELVALCEKLLAANPKTIADVQSGKVQAVGALIGQAKKLNPNVDPKPLPRDLFTIDSVCSVLSQMGFRHGSTIISRRQSSRSRPISVQAAAMSAR